MFDIAPSELMLVAAVALVVIGPSDLPKAMRFVGQWVGRARGMARHFRSGIDEIIRQAELDEMQKKWAAENARIMAEHPVVPLAEADDEMHDDLRALAPPAPASLDVAVTDGVHLRALAASVEPEPAHGVGHAAKADLPPAAPAKETAPDPDEPQLPLALPHRGEGERG